ncbi:MAG TPA: tripartite tricarboxylate transporter substrate-binding protein [Alphaproteobacteria bacterium]|jgi:tripartite-type tricarboxylate transporter receptor subunit TctC
MRILRGLGAAVVAAAAMTLPGAGQAAFPERDIAFIIPYSPGGGFDTYVRRIAPVMQRYLPNKVNVVPKNIVGTGGRRALATLYREKPDGYAISIFNMPGMLLDKILGEKTAYDIDGFTWLGRLGSSKYALAVSAKSGFASVKDLKGKPLKYAITNWNSGSYVAGRIMAEAMGLDITFLPGYKGSSDVSLSMVRGDTHLSLFNSVSAGKWAEGGDLKNILSFEPKSPWPGVSTAKEVGHPELEVLTVDRYVGGPPGMKPDVAKTLSDALLKALADKEIQDWAKKTGSSIDPLSGPKAAKELGKLAKFYGKYKEPLAKR